jgi:WD40 repeat protein
MPSDPPVDFQALAQGAAGTTNKDYPYAIKATDLMRNFVFATLDIEDGLVEETTGAQGHRQRKFKVPAPQGESEVEKLVYRDGNFFWVASIPNGTINGQVVFWNQDEEEWKLTEGELESGQMLAWNAEEFKWIYTPIPEEDGQILTWDNEEKKWKHIPAPTQDGEILYWDAEEKEWRYIPAPTQDGQILTWDEAEKEWKYSVAPTEEGQIFKWDDEDKVWVPFSGGSEGDLLQWDSENGWESVGAGSVEGQLLNWDATDNKWVPFEAAPEEGTYVLGAVDGVMQWVETEACD